MIDYVVIDDRKAVDSMVIYDNEHEDVVVISSECGLEIFTGYKET